MEEEQLFKQLLKRYRTNQLSQEEYQRFIDLIDKDGMESNETLETLAIKDWHPSMDLLEHIRKEEKLNSRRIYFRQWAWSSAAAIALLCLAWFLWPQQVSDNLVYQTGYGETQNIELPDGSKVLLNANSSLIWMSEWESSKQRQVTLTGEAFFDVMKVEHIPFEVVASDLHVNVLGTEFNVRNRDADAEVFLYEGKVDLQVNSDSNNKITMKPGDFVRYDKSDQTISVTEHEQMDRKAAWVDGMLQFENKKVGLILREFEDLYGKKFLIENKELANRRMDFSLPYADWELVRKALEIAIGAEFIESQDTIIVK